MKRFINEKSSVWLVFAIMISLLVSGCFGNYYIYKREDKILKIILSPDRKYFLTIVDQESYMAFGSGWKELRLYSSYRLLGKCTFGRFNFDIEKWDIENNEIIIKIDRYRRQEDYSFINYWTNENTHIGKFKITYHYLNFVEIDN